MRSLTTPVVGSPTVTLCRCRVAGAGAVTATKRRAGPKRICILCVVNERNHLLCSSRSKATFFFNCSHVLQKNWWAEPNTNCCFSLLWKQSAALLSFQTPLVVDGFSSLGDLANGVADFHLGRVCGNGAALDTLVTWEENTKSRSKCAGKSQGDKGFRKDAWT